MHQTRSVPDRDTAINAMSNFSKGLQAIVDLSDAQPAAVPVKALTALTTDLEVLTSIVNSLGSRTSMPLTAEIDTRLGSAYSDAGRAVELLSAHA